MTTKQTIIHHARNRAGVLALAVALSFFTLGFWLSLTDWTGRFIELGISSSIVGFALLATGEETIEVPFLADSKASTTPQIKGPTSPLSLEARYPQFQTDQRVRLECPECGLLITPQMQARRDAEGKWHHESCFGATLA